MPSSVTPGVDFTVRVRLSRGRLEPTEGTVHASETVHVDAERPLSVQVYAKCNVQVLEPEAKVFGLPSGDWASELTFRGRAFEAGPVEVSVVLRQGRVPVAPLALEASAGAAGLLAQALVSGAVHTGIDAPELDGLPCLDIVEGRRVTGERVYSYALRLVPGEPARVFESAPVVGRDDFVRERIAEVERVITDPDLTPRQRLAQLQNTGTMLFDQFFPEDMQDYLWEHREPRARPHRLHRRAVRALGARPPQAGPGKRGTDAALPRPGGLVRWQLGSFPPKQSGCVVARARSICPVYANPMFSNDVGVAEAGYLKDRFGAKAVDGDARRRRAAAARRAASTCSTSPATAPRAPTTSRTPRCSSRG